MKIEKLTMAIAIGGLALGLCACSSTASSTPKSTSASPSKPASASSTAAFQCPKTSTKVAWAGASPVPWSTATVSAINQEATSCKTIGKIAVEAATSLPQAESQLAALQAEGTKIIIQEPEYGPAELPAMQKLVSAGTIIVPVLNDPGGSAPTDFNAAAFQDTTAGPAEWAKFFSETVKSGNIAFLGGTPGATSSEAWFSGLQTALKAYPSLHLVNSQFIVTNWDAGDVTSAVAGLLAKYGRIAGIAMDYGVTSTGVVSAYQDAHMALPAIATVASGEVNACEWQKDQFPYMTLGGSTYLGALALKMAVQIENGQKVPVASVALPTVVDTATGLNPPSCNSSFSADSPMTQVLPAAQRTKAEQAVLSAA